MADLRSLRPRLAAPVAAVIAALVTALVLVPATPAQARTVGARGGDAYLTRLLVALDTCLKSDRDAGAAAVSRCVYDLAAPNPASSAEIDLFRVFTNCLAAADGPDSMYPGVHPAEVNQCLEDWGVL